MSCEKFPECLYDYDNEKDPYPSKNLSWKERQDMMRELQEVEVACHETLKKIKKVRKILE